MKGTYSTTTVSFAVLLAFSGLAGCAGGYGSEGSAATEGSGYKAETAGQQLLLETTQQRRTMETTTQAPDVPIPASTAPNTCEGYPGFDRGCPVGTK